MYIHIALCMCIWKYIHAHTFLQNELFMYTHFRTAFSLFSIKIGYWGGWPLSPVIPNNGELF